MKSFPHVIRKIRNIDGWLSDTEALFLYTAAATTRGVIVEIGSWKGKSTVCLGSGAGKTKSLVYAVDPHMGVVDEHTMIKHIPTYRQFLNTINNSGLQKKIVPIRKTSKDAISGWNTPIAVLFIDGLHDWNHASEDFSLWSPFVEDGGLIAFHDAYGGIPGSEKAAKECLLQTGYSGQGISGSILYGFKKKEIGGIGTIRTFIRCSLIHLGSWIYAQKSILYVFRFFIAHRLIKLFLFDRIHRQMETYRV